MKSITESDDEINSSHNLDRMVVNVPDFKSKGHNFKVESQSSKTFTPVKNKDINNKRQDSNQIPVFSMDLNETPIIPDDSSKDQSKEIFGNPFTNP